MKIAIITFSPSGNSARVGLQLKEELEQLGGVVDFYDITKNFEIFDKGDYLKYLKNNIKEHDVLCLGAPVYEHHLQEYMVKLIKELPAPNDTWGSYALPFVTYGRICSGSALEDAGKLLRLSGRTVISGLKVATPHTMLETLLKREVGLAAPKEEVQELLVEAAKRIIAINGLGEVLDHSGSLRYQSFKKRLFDNTVLNPKMKFINLLPKIELDVGKCTKCRLCIKICPTNHLFFGEDGKLMTRSESSCVHCFNCVKQCKCGAIESSKSRKTIEFVFKLITRGGLEKPQNQIYPNEVH